MRILVLEKECSVTRDMVKNGSLPSDLTYPVSLSHDVDCVPNVLNIKDGNSRQWCFEL